MTDLDRALSDLQFIQDRVSASTRFRGFAPHGVAATGVLAIVLAAAQALRPGTFASDPLGYVAAWTAAAVAAAGLVGAEALGRSRRLHGGLADAMLASALRLLLPFGATGAAATLVLVRAAPDALWVLPGLWQLLVALAGFSAVGTLPRSVAWAASWYLLCGTAVLLAGAEGRALEPWMMGVPFGVGQLLVAAALLREGGTDGRR